MTDHAARQVAKPEPMTEQRAREILGVSITANGSIYASVNYVYWLPGDDKATLDDRFSADELEAIAWWMRNKP